MATDAAADHTGHRLVAGHDPAAVPRRGHVGDRQRPAPVATAWDERLASGLRFGEREPGRTHRREHPSLTEQAMLSRDRHTTVARLEPAASTRAATGDADVDIPAGQGLTLAA